MGATCPLYAQPQALPGLPGLGPLENIPAPLLGQMFEFHEALPWLLSSLQELSPGLRTGLRVRGLQCLQPSASRATPKGAGLPVG